MKKTLEELRKEIDNADEELVKAIAKRFEIIREIGKLKKEKNIPVLDEKRWDEVLKRISEKAKKLDVPEELMKKMYQEIHKAALMIEKKDE